MTLVTYGTITNNVMEAAELLAAQGIHVTVLRLLQVNPLPADELMRKMTSNHQVIVVEETCTGSGIREDLAWALRQKMKDCKVYGLDLGGGFVTHGSLNMLYRHCGLDSQSIAAYVKEVLGYEN